MKNGIRILILLVFIIGGYFLSLYLHHERIISKGSAFVTITLIPFILYGILDYFMSYKNILNLIIWIAIGVINYIFSHLGAISLLFYFLLPIVGFYLTTVIKETKKMNDDFKNFLNKGDENMIQELIQIKHLSYDNASIKNVISTNDLYTSSFILGKEKIPIQIESIKKIDDTNYRLITLTSPKIKAIALIDTDESQSYIKVISTKKIIGINNKIVKDVIEKISV